MLLYAAIMALAIGTAIAIARHTQTDLGLTRHERLGIGIGAFVGAMLGAKLPFVFSDWDAFQSGATWFSDGKTIMTGLVGGYLGVVAAKWSLGIQTRTGDSFAVPVA